MTTHTQLDQLKLLQQGHAPRDDFSPIYTPLHAPRPATIQCRRLLQDRLDMHTRSQRAFVPKMQRDIETPWKPRGCNRRILIIHSAWPDLDRVLPTARSQDLTMPCRIPTDIFRAIESEKIEPDDGVVAQPAMTPEPAPDIRSEGLVAPVLR